MHRRMSCAAYNKYCHAPGTDARTTCRVNSSAAAPRAMARWNRAGGAGRRAPRDALGARACFFGFDRAALAMYWLCCAVRYAPHSMAQYMRSVCVFCGLDCATGYECALAHCSCATAAWIAGAPALAEKASRCRVVFRGDVVPRSLSAACRQYLRHMRITYVQLFPVLCLCI